MDKDKKFMKYYLKTRGWIFLYIGFGALLIFSIFIRNNLLAIISSIGFAICPIGGMIYLVLDSLKMSIDSAKKEINKKTPEKANGD